MSSFCHSVQNQYWETQLVLKYQVTNVHNWNAQDQCTKLKNIQQINRDNE